MDELTGPKCTVTDGVLTPCYTLDEAIEGPFSSKRKGVTLIETADLKTMRIKRSGVVLRSGSLGPGGVILNYCPFCGESIAKQFLPEPAPVDDVSEAR